MPWWGWMVTGTVLFAAELFGINAEFYLVFLGTAALAVGVPGWLGYDWPSWAQWLAFAVLSVTFMVTFRRRVYRRFHAAAHAPAGAVEPGGAVTLPQALAAGASCRVEYRGSTWNARNIDTRPFAIGDLAEVADVDGLTLQLRHPAGS